MLLLPLKLKHRILFVKSFQILLFHLRSEFLCTFGISRYSDLAISAAVF